MDNYCAFIKDKKCILWTDYEITRYELEEANNLCHENWIEIQTMQDYIKALQNILINNGLDFPGEF